MSNRALVFEDNPINSKLMTMFLEQSGYYVDLALSFDELQTKIINGYDLLFIDVSSPALTRDTLETFVKKSKASTFFKCPPIIAVLNNAKEADIKYYLNMGMDGYVSKPISVKLLRDTIDRVRSGLSSPTPGEDVVDVEKLSRTLGIPDKKMLIGLFDQFFTSTQKEIKQMRAAITLKDYASLRSLAHNIKGSARNLRLSNIGKLAEEIETQTKYPSASLDLTGVINSFEAACLRVYNEFYARYQKES